MNLRGIKILDLDHSVLDNSVIEGLEHKIEKLKTGLDKLKTDATKEKRLTELLSLDNELQKEREAIEEEQRRGQYRFKLKTYVNYRDAGRRPPYKFKWCWYSDSDNYGMYRDWQVSFGAAGVTYGKDRYVPEGVPVNSENHYVFKDVILMKEDLQNYLRRSIKQRLKAEGAGKSEFDQLESQFAAEGAKIDDSMMNDILSEGGR